MDARKIYKFNCLKNIIDKLIKNKCILNNENKIKKALMLIIKENPPIAKNSFAFLFKNASTNYGATWDAETKKLDVKISTVCKPDSISLEIVDAYLKSKLITGDDFAKMSCILNEGKNSKIKEIFEVAQDAVADDPNPGFIAAGDLTFGVTYIAALSGAEVGAFQASGQSDIAGLPVQSTLIILNSLK